MPSCPSCRADIIWAITAARKRQPLNREPDPAGNTAAYRDGTGTWLARALKADEEPFGWERRYMPHAATCTSPPQRGRPPVAAVPAVLPPNVIPFRRPDRSRPPKR